MEEMFQGASSFTGIGIGAWDVCKVRTFQDCFRNCTSFNQQLDGAWATNKTRVKGYMFAGCDGGSIVGKTNDRFGTPGGGDYAC